MDEEENNATQQMQNNKINKAKEVEEVEEYEVYFATPDGKFLEGTKKDRWNCTLIDTEPTSFFTIKINRKKGYLDVDKEDTSIMAFGFKFPMFYVANGEAFSAKETNAEYTFIYNDQCHLTLASLAKIKENDVILTVEFVNQAKHVIK